MNYNAIISVEDITDESGVYEEPVSIEEMKDYLRLEGYIDTDESTADDLSEFDFDDTLIAQLIKTSREKIEKKAWISILPKTLEVVLHNSCGMIELPYGPVGTIVSIYDENDVAIETTNYKVKGNQWKYLKEPCQRFITITYEAGYDECPAPLKTDIMRLCAYMYENRGDDPAIEEFSYYISSKYSRNTGIV